MVRTVAAGSRPPITRLTRWPARGGGARRSSPLRGVAGAHVRRRRRPLALEAVPAVPAGARARLAGLGVATAARCPAVATAFLPPAHRLLRLVIASAPIAGPPVCPRPPPRCSPGCP